jgi:mevalonate kinase
MNSVRGHGHGKVILLGEHSVVHGRPAIAAGIPLGCEARAQVAERDSLSVAPWGVTVYPDQAEDDRDREQLRRAFGVLCERCSSQRPALAIQANMQIPAGAGLGSSSALSVAVLRALDAAASVTRDDRALVELSLAWEQVFHGNPSGVDSAMAVRGGLAWYVRGQALAPLSAAKPLSLVVANSGEHGSTKKTVGRVGELYAQDAAGIGARFDRIAELVHAAKAALAAGDHAQLGALMDENQTHLGVLEVSTPTLEGMCEIARGAGALGAKLTGGGGGGCMIALAKHAADSGEIARALSAEGYEAFVVEVIS